VSLIWADNFEPYGNDINAVLDGFYAEIGAEFGVGLEDTELAIPDFDEQNRYWLRVNGRGGGLRRVLGGIYTSIGFCEGFYLATLPSTTDRTWIVEFRDSTNGRVFKVAVTTDGNLALYNQAGAIVAQTTNSPITAGNYYTIQGQFVLHATTGTAEIRVNGQGDGAELTPVIGGTSSVPGTNLVLPGAATQLFVGASPAASGGSADTYYKFFVPYSLTGTYNSDWPRISGVATLWINSDTEFDDFTPRPFTMYGAGVLFIGDDGNGDVLDCGTSATFDLSSDDFTLEGTFRWGGEPTGSDFATLLGRWNASGSARSYRLVKYGPSLNAGALRFEITTDGTLSTLNSVISVLYDFQVGHQYTIAVCRSSGITRLFINGNQVGVDQSDAFVYYATGISAKFTVGGEISGTGISVLANSSFKGHVDEVRITPGVARYTADYTPSTTIFPRSVIDGDVDFDSVVLLAGFDEGITDLSSYARNLTARGDTARVVPEDAGALYLAANTAPPQDTRFMEAAFLPATGILTMNALPVATDIVTLGSDVYTFVDTVVSAYDVLIGVDVPATLANLRSAINAGPGAGTTYGAATSANTSAAAALGPDVSVQLTATALTAGAVGNSIVSTTDVTDATWTGTTLGGGQDIPAPVEFTIDALPIAATGLRGLFLVDRAFLNADSGSAKKSFVVDGFAADGSDNSLTDTPVYRGDMIEEDPDTAAGLTPQSVLVGRLRYTRTA